MARDGHLEERDLDELIGADDVRPADGRQPADFIRPEGSTARVDEIGVGSDRPRLGERPVPRWLGRHRVLAALLAGPVLASGVGARLLHPLCASPTRDPSAAPVVVLESIVDGGPAPDDIGGRLLTRLLLTPRPGQQGPPELSTFGLLGTGLAQPQAVRVDEHATASNIVECDALPDLVGFPGPYVLRVAADDGNGDPRPANLRVAGEGSARIWRAVAQHWARTATDRLTLETIRPGTGPAAGALWLDLRNPSPWDLYLLGAAAQVWPGDTGGAPPASTRWHSPQPLRLAAGRTTRVRLQLKPRPRYCRTAWITAAPQWAVATPVGRRGGDFSLWLKAGSSTGPAGTEVDTTLWLRPEQRAAVLAALRAPCAGAARQ